MAIYEVDYAARSVILPIDSLTARQDVMMGLFVEGFKWKTDHHITAVPSEFGRQMSLKAFQRLGGMLAEIDCNDYQVENEAFVVQRPKQVWMQESNTWWAFPRKSLIAPAFSRQMFDDLLEVYERVDVDPRLPFQHVTLATGDRSVYDRRGIGLPTRDDFEKYRVPGESIIGWKE